MICPPAYSYGYLQSMMRNDWTVSLYTPFRRSDSVWGVMVWRSWTFPGVVGRQSGNLPSPVLSVCSRATSGEWFSLLSLLNKNSWLKKKVHEKKWGFLFRKAISIASDCNTRLKLKSLRDLCVATDMKVPSWYYVMLGIFSEVFQNTSE